jgi:hypothetical protein
VETNGQDLNLHGILHILGEFNGFTSSLPIPHLAYPFRHHCSPPVILEWQNFDSLSNRNLSIYHQTSYAHIKPFSNPGLVVSFLLRRAFTYGRK